MIENAVYNAIGLVAVQYYQPTPKLVSVARTQYYFDCQHGVAIAWVHVPAMLSYVGGCCGGGRLVMSLASDAVVRHWQDGQGGR